MEDDSKLKVQFWTKTFLRSKKKLKKAIKKIGVSAGKVEAFLKKNKSLFEWEK